MGVGGGGGDTDRQTDRDRGGEEGSTYLGCLVSRQS